MRAAGFLVPASMAGLFGMVVNCTPRDDLSAFSAGTQATDQRPLEPAGQGPGTLPEPSEPADGEAAARTSEMPESSDVPAAPTDLVGGGDPAPGGAVDQDAAGSDPAETPPPAEPSSTPPASTAPASTAPASTAPPAVQQFRFVRLVADSDVTAGPLTSIAEFDVLGADGQPIDHSGWVATADSAEQVFVGGAPAALAIDGQAMTMWHTPWFQVVPPPHPHFLQVDLGQPRTLSGFRYLARQDGAADGRIAAYRFFVSADGVDWGSARAAGTLANTDQPQDVPVR